MSETASEAVSGKPAPEPKPGTAAPQHEPAVAPSDAQPAPAQPTVPPPGDEPTTPVVLSDPDTEPTAQLVLPSAGEPVPAPEGGATTEPAAEEPPAAEPAAEVPPAADPAAEVGPAQETAAEAAPPVEQAAEAGSTHTPAADVRPGGAPPAEVSTAARAPQSVPEPASKPEAAPDAAPETGKPAAESAAQVPSEPAPSPPAPSAPAPSAPAPSAPSATEAEQATDSPTVVETAQVRATPATSDTAQAGKAPEKRPTADADEPTARIDPRPEQAEPPAPPQPDRPAGPSAGPRPSGDRPPKIDQITFVSSSGGQPVPDHPAPKAPDQPAAAEPPAAEAEAAPPASGAAPAASGPPAPPRWTPPPWASQPTAPPTAAGPTPSAPAWQGGGSPGARRGPAEEEPTAAIHPPRRQPAPQDEPTAAIPAPTRGEQPPPAPTRGSAQVTPPRTGQQAAGRASVSGPPAAPVAGPPAAGRAPAAYPERTQARPADQPPAAGRASAAMPPAAGRATPPAAGRARPTAPAPVGDDEPPTQVLGWPVRRVPAAAGRAQVSPAPGGLPPRAAPQHFPAPAEVEPAKPARGRRTRAVALLVALVVLMVGAGLVLVVRPGPVDRWLAGPEPAPTTPPPAPDPVPPPVLAAVAADGAGPDAAGVSAAVGGLIRASGLGGRMNVSIVDVASGQPLYVTNEDDLTVPASTTKLVTAAAVLASRGAAYRIPTRVVAGARPGEVVIVGGGDPTLGAGSRSAYPGVARLDRLAAQVKKALGDTRPTKVVVDGSLFSGPVLGPGWDPDVVSPGGYAAPITALMVDGGRREPKLSGHGDARDAQPDLAAGADFARLLGLSGASRGTAPEPAVTEPSALATADGDGTAAAPLAPGTELGRVDSPPMVRLVEWMLEASDNVIAEALARQVALAQGEEASFAGAQAAMDEVVAALGLNAAESELRDGSGLSRLNEVSPSLLTDVLALSAGGSRPELAELFAGLPVAGWSGTLADRFVTAQRNAAGQGAVRAKTGTLNGVSSLSGVVATQSGHLLAFAIMADGVTAGTEKARRVLDGIVAALVACGCRT
ncbi:hypothetical protein GCM10009524_56100 [Spirilliplanes yamanashiensis]